MSAPPSYNHVVQNNQQFPVTSRSNAPGADGATGAPSETTVSNATSSGSTNSDAPPPSYNDYSQRDPGSVNVAYNARTDGVQMSTVL